MRAGCTCLRQPLLYGVDEQGNIGRMDMVKQFALQAASVTATATFTMVGVLASLCLLSVWCLLVFLLTGRLPWFVRRYF